MPLYRLDPIDIAHGDWKASSYCGDCRVAARSENEARTTAARQFARAPLSLGAASVRRDASPWFKPALVRCTEIPRTAGSPLPLGTVELPNGRGWRPVAAEA